MKIFPNLSEIADSYNALLLDAYGVFWGGNAYGFFPGAKEQMEKFVLQGKKVGIISNATQLAEREKEKLAKQGLIEGKHYHFYLTSGSVARSMFLQATLPFPTPRKKFWLFNGVHPKFSHEPMFMGSEYEGTAHVDEADFIFISVPHIGGEDQFDPELFREAVSALKGTKIPMLCVNPDRFAHEGLPPRPVVRQGTIAALYEEMGGKVYYIGKPESKLYLAAISQLERLGVHDWGNILMVRDTPETDIRGANQVGILSALILETGMMAERIVEKGELALNELPERDRPTYYIETFA